MKKMYMKPVIEAICTETLQMLATSGESDEMNITIDDGTPIDDIVFY